MKTIKTWLTTIAVLLCSISASAHDFEVDGIYYKRTSDTTVEVTFRGSLYNSYHREYSDDVLIPSIVTYSGKEYSVTSIGQRVFYYCDGLTSVTIPNSVTSIGGSAFKGCSCLTSVTIPNSVTSIGGSAFEECSGLTSVNIPNSVTSIGGSAFRGCSGLKSSVTIPNSVTSIGGSAFQGCSGLTSVTIGNGVELIQSYSFAGCSGLTSVTIGNGVERIWSYIFSGCSALKDVYCYAEKVPSTYSDAFRSSNYSYVTLHVPAGSIEKYKAQTPWSNCGKIVALTDEETGIEELKSENGNVKTAIFDLSGRRVQKAQKGIFIQNEKKVIIK